MTDHRAMALALAGLILAAPVPASAQISDDIVLSIMRQCARIDDATARLACYDNNIRAEDGASRPAAGRTTVPQGGAGAPVAANSPSGFGRESVRTTTRFETPEGQLSGITARITDVAQREPGVYLITLSDGAQWVFTESMPFSYRPPREGSSVSIDRAAMGSFLMRFDDQESVRVRRVR